MKDELRNVIEVILIFNFPRNIKCIKLPLFYYIWISEGKNKANLPRTGFVFKVEFVFKVAAMISGLPRETAE